MADWLKLPEFSITGNDGKIFKVEIKFYVRIDYKNFNFIGLPDSYSDY